MTIQTWSVSFSFIVCRYSSKWRLEISKKLKKVATTLPHPLTFTAYPTPGKVAPPIFFDKMTAKDVKEITYYMP